MIYFYIPFAALLAYLSLRSLLSGVAYLKYFKQELEAPASGYTPFATIIAPCKGLEQSLADNLRALLDQNYPAYEVLFVVDDLNDPAVPLIDNICRAGRPHSRLIVAPPATRSGQKVENLRTAVTAADERSRVFVFVDSDVRPSKDWLASLVAPIEDEKIGASTGYRWFVSYRSSLAAEIRSAWNASIASALGPETASNFCWGGSTAISRDVFHRLHVSDGWKGTVSDDFALTRMLTTAGLQIKFVPKALVESNGACTVRQLFEFTNRQMKITRVYAKGLWIRSIIGSGLFNAVFVGSLLLVVLFPTSSLETVAAVSSLFFITALSTAKAWLRFRAVQLVLRSEAVHRQLLYQLTLWLVTPAIFLINSIAALFSTTIVWRGIEYQMVSAAETSVRRIVPEKRL